MNVKRIVVDEGEELPENCFTCELSQKIQLDIYCPILNKKIFDSLGFRPEACPLEVDECCEWKLNKHDGDNDFQIPQYEGKCGAVWYEGIKQYMTFCPNCGKYIKYVEVE